MELTRERPSEISKDYSQALNQNDRVRDSFPLTLNKRIDIATESRMAEAQAQGSDAIQRHIGTLEREWDIDRAVMMTFGILGGATLSAGLFKNKRWLPLLGIQFLLLLNHAIKGWCPPASVFRRMGFRTQKEIEAERHILLSLAKRPSQNLGPMREVG